MKLENIILAASTTCFAAAGGLIAFEHFSSNPHLRFAALICFVTAFMIPIAPILLLLALDTTIASKLLRAIRIACVTLFVVGVGGIVFFGDPHYLPIQLHGLFLGPTIAMCSSSLWEAGVPWTTNIRIKGIPGKILASIGIAFGVGIAVFAVALLVPPIQRLFDMWQ